jgi:hypothetical protein
MFMFWLNYVNRLLRPSPPHFNVHGDTMVESLCHHCMVRTPLEIPGKPWNLDIALENPGKPLNCLEGPWKTLEINIMVRNATYSQNITVRDTMYSSNISIIMGPCKSVCTTSSLNPTHHSIYAALISVTSS